MTERPAATLAVSGHTYRVCRKRASFHRRGWSRQARDNSVESHKCPQSILPPDGCWHPAPPSGLSGCPHPDMLFLSTATSLPLLCRTCKRGIGGKGEWRHLARIRWKQMPLSPSSTSIAVIFPYLFIRARSDHFSPPSLSSSLFAMITPGLRD